MGMSSRTAIIHKKSTENAVADRVWLQRSGKVRMTTRTAFLGCVSSTAIMCQPLQAKGREDVSNMKAYGSVPVVPLLQGISARSEFRPGVHILLGHPFSVILSACDGVGPWRPSRRSDPASGQFAKANGRGALWAGKPEANRTPIGPDRRRRLVPYWWRETGEKHYGQSRKRVESLEWQPFFNR